MPNPNPPRRSRPTPSTDTLPPGVRLRPDGRLERRYTNASGERDSVYGRTLDDLYRKLAERQASPIPSRDAAITVAVYLRLWIAGLTVRPNSIATHAGNVERYLIPSLGSRVRLGELTPDHVRAAYAMLRSRPGKSGRPLAPRTLRLAHATLRRALAQAQTDGRIATNPARGIDPAAGIDGALERRRIPTPDELRAVDRAMRGDALRPLYLLAAMTGLRQSEALGLRWSDVFLEERWIHVGGALRRLDRKIGPTNSAAGVRGMRLAGELVDELRAHRAAQARERLAAGPTWADLDLVFADELGRPLAGRSVTRWFQRRCRAAGVPSYRWHDLRHAWVSGALEHGVAMPVVSKLAGHSSIAITVDLYGHLADDASDPIAEISAARVLAR